MVVICIIPQSAEKRNWFAICVTCRCLGGEHHLAVFPFYRGLLPSGVPFGHPKGTEKVPATSDSAGGPAQGARPLGTPKRWSGNEKAKKCRNDCIFLTALCTLPTMTPPGPKWTLWGQRVAPLCKGGSADRRWGIVTLPIHRTTAQGYNHSAPAGHPLTRRAPLSLRDISPHCGESPFTQGRLCGAMQASPPTRNRTVAIGVRPYAPVAVGSVGRGLDPSKGPCHNYNSP